MPRSKYTSSTSRYGRISLSLMKAQRIRVISSPSSSTIGFKTLIFAIGRAMLPARQSRPPHPPYEGAHLKRQRGEKRMNTYAIRRERAWESAEELGKTAERSKEVAASDFPDDIAWIRSYVIKEEGGTLGTICIYQASSIDKVKEHAQRVDMPADEVLEIADTVIVRPDPQPQAA